MEQASNPKRGGHRPRRGVTKTKGHIALAKLLESPSLNEVAGRAGISRSHLQSIVAGKAAPSALEAKALETATGILAAEWSVAATAE